jgi:hypothetical protein
MQCFWTHDIHFTEEHSNYWESREIAHIFARLDFSVDAVA